jgi:hypothetical protein
MDGFVVALGCATLEITAPQLRDHLDESHRYHTGHCNRPQGIQPINGTTPIQSKETPQELAVRGGAAEGCEDKGLILYSVFLVHIISGITQDNTAGFILARAFAEGAFRYDSSGL